MGEVRVHDHNRTYALAALDDECRKLASLTQGSGRNTALNSAAFSLGQFVPSGALTEAEIKEAIFNASVSNGYVHQDGREAALKTIESGLRAGMQQPRTVPQSDHGRRRTHRGNGQHRPRTEPTIEAGDTIVGDPVGELLAQPPNRVPVPMAEPDWNNPGREFFYNSADGEKVLHKSVRFPLIYPDGTPALSKKGKPDKTFVQFHQDERGAWVKGRGGDAVPYHLDDLAAVRQAGRTDVVVLIFEGEAKADLVHQRDKDKSIIAISIPKGCKGYGPRFAGLPTVIFPDNDDPGRKYRDLVAAEINPHAASVRVAELDGLGEGEDVVDWSRKPERKERGDIWDQFFAIIDAAVEWKPPHPEPKPTETPKEGVMLENFRAYMVLRKYIFTPSGDMWPMGSVNSRIPPVPLFDAEGKPLLDGNGNQKEISASLWLDQNQPVEQLTWAPGQPKLIGDRLISEGGRINHKGVSIFNLYLPPTIKPRNPDGAGRWIEHLERIYRNDIDHIISWFAHRRQRPYEKINHALVLGGPQGIGKDTILEAVRHAVGPWNFQDVNPKQTMGRFNGFLKSVILRISEARDRGGEFDRYDFYEHTKTYIAAPPDVHRVDEKHLREHYIININGVIITTNHKADGIYLPDDDCRHYVAWSERTKEEFSKEYWSAFWTWYGNGGIEDVVAYLDAVDLSDFDPKAPPKQTQAFWEIVNSNRSTEDAEFADALDKLKVYDQEVKKETLPRAVTLGQIRSHAEGDFLDWLNDRKNRRAIPHRLETVGYVPVRNDDAKDGLWKIGDTESG